VVEGRLGRKAGEGFYGYGPNASRLGLAASFDTAVPDGLDGAAIRERITAAIREEARNLAAAGIATEEAIGLALRLGAGHPRSPFD
jgi:3-hydroxyacyl-CoA dehydrogenase